MKYEATTILLGALLTAFAASACHGIKGTANYLDIVSRRHEPDATHGYVYGRFELVGPSGHPAPRISVGLRSTKTKETYHIMLNTKYPVFAVRVPPGDYEVAHIMLSGRSRDVTKDAEFSPLDGPFSSLEFTVRAGELCYIGDYIATIAVRGRRYVFGPVSSEIAYEETSEALFERFARLSDLDAYPAWDSTEDAMVAFLPYELSLSIAPSKQPNQGRPLTAEEVLGHKISVEIFLEPSAPENHTALMVLVPMMKALGSWFYFSINFVKPDSNTGPQGQEEGALRSAAIQLCSYEQGSAGQALRFLECAHSYHGYQEDEHWRACSKLSGLNAEKLFACAESDDARAKALDSFEASSERGLKSTPAVLIDDVPFDGLLIESTLARNICSRIHSQTPSYCFDIAEKEPLRILFLGDARCPHALCDPRELTLVERLREYRGVTIETLDYSSLIARDLFDASRAKHLPLMLISSNLSDHQEALVEAAPYLEPLEEQVEGYRYMVPFDIGWDPRAEICDDGADNDEDDRIDCEDPECHGHPICRAEIPLKLEFVARYSPTSTSWMVLELAEVVDHFKRHGVEIVLEINLSAHAKGHADTGSLFTFRDSYVEDEVKRSLCVQKIYSEGSSLLDYMTCRAYSEHTAYFDTLPDIWRKCATGGINARKIQRCYTSEEGACLLRKSESTIDNLPVLPTPVFIVNGRHMIHTYSASDVASLLCEKNPSTAGCDSLEDLTERLSHSSPGGNER